jgi:hypothetical protein
MAKTLEHIVDYIRAVSRYGSKFYDIKGARSISSKVGHSKNQEINQTLFNGRGAREHIFSEDGDSALSFMPTCEILGINAQVIRNTLAKMTQEQARKLWPLCQSRKFPKGDWGGNQWMTGEEKNARRI